MGFTEGLFKVATGGKLDCLDEGMTIGRGLMRLVDKLVYTDEPRTDMDSKNIVEMLWTLMERCNYHSTLEGIVLSSMLTKKILIEFDSPWNVAFFDIWIAYEMFVNMVDDGVTIIFALWRFSLHYDLYNSSLIIGRLVKIIAQYSFYSIFEHIIAFIPPEVIVTKN